MRRAVKSSIAFGITGLVGPLLWNIVPHPSPAETFVSDLVFLLWPTQLVGVVEFSMGERSALAITAVSNLVLLAALGWVVGWLGRTRHALLLAYCLLTSLLFCWALWGGGFSVAHFGVSAFVVALIVYAIPFWFVLWSTGEATPKPPEPAR